MWVYDKRHGSPSRWVVGFYAPSGRWITESIWPSRRDAVLRVRYLYGADGDLIQNNENYSERRDDDR